MGWPSRARRYFDWRKTQTILIIMPLSGMYKEMRRIFKTLHFSQAMKKSRLKDEALEKSAFELFGGLHDGNLGGNVFKKRVSLSGKGKRGSARTLVVLQRERHCFFLYGFKKNDRATITELELEALQFVAKDLLSLDDEQISSMVLDGALKEIIYGKA